MGKAKTWSILTKKKNNRKVLKYSYKSKFVSNNYILAVVTCIMEFRVQREHSVTALTTNSILVAISILLQNTF